MYLLFALFLAFILIIWFETEAVAEYATLFDLYWIHPSVESFLRIRNQGSPQTYIEHISQAYDCFFVRLITCPKCLSTWLGGAFGAITLVPVCFSYGLLAGLACASALPYLTYIAYQVSKKLK